MINKAIYTMKIIHILCLLPLCLMLSVTHAQETKDLRIAGTVVDENGEPLPGVSIYIKDRPAAGTSSDGDGKFALSVVYGDWLVFSFVGYEPVEHLAVASTNNLAMQLTEKSAALDEVVVV